jgi:hypothetical protein
MYLFCSSSPGPCERGITVINFLEIKRLRDRGWIKWSMSHTSRWQIWVSVNPGRMVSGCMCLIPGSHCLPRDWVSKRKVHFPGMKPISLLSLENCQCFLVATLSHFLKPQLRDASNFLFTAPHHLADQETGDGEGTYPRSFQNGCQN